MKPDTEAALAEMIRAAKGPMTVRGGGTRSARKAGGDVIDTSALQGITLYEPGALTMVAKTGTPLEEIEAALQDEGQRLAFEPMDHRPLLGTTGTPTLGGMVAANVSGPRRIQAGACRDFMLGVRFVDGAGTIIKNGGRVMKNVTGYDLVKLMAGSWGTLGVLSEVSFKVLPKPDFEATLVVHGLDLQQGVDTMSKALGSPYEITGAAYLPGNDTQDAQTHLRLEGFENSVRYRIDALKELLDASSEISVSDTAQSTKTWADVRDVRQFANHAGDVWRISVRPTYAPEIVNLLGAEASMMLDWGGGLIWALVPEDTDVRARLGVLSGHAMRVRARADATTSIPMFHPEPAPLATISSGLRARFDPRGILNPGMMGA